MSSRAGSQCVERTAFLWSYGHCMGRREHFGVDEGLGWAVVGNGGQDGLGESRGSVGKSKPLPVCGHNSSVESSGFFMGRERAVFS